MKNIILSLLPLSIFLITGCNKYDDTAAATSLQVPPFTETGANTFGCYLNGGAWANLGETYTVAEEGFGKLYPNRVIASVGQSYLTGIDSMFYISATLTVSHNGKVSRQEDMSISMPKIGSLLGTHKFTDSTTVFSYHNEVNFTEYFSFKRNPFTVTILKDSIAGNKHIVSGKFSGTLFNNFFTDSLKIKGGVFDATLMQ